MVNTKGAKDFTTGPIFAPMLLFALPIIATNCLQLLYNTADKIVVGQFSGNENALAAIGCTVSLYALITALCNGLSMGSGVTVARRFGAHDGPALSRAVHTAFIVGGTIGTVIGVIGFLFCKQFLIWMGTDPAILDDATLYMRIIFVGTPASILYNFGAAILRSVGNSRMPLFILGGSGILNVGFNLIFVLGFGMHVDGVAFGTIISQYASALVVWSVLSRRQDSARFSFGALCVDRGALADALRIGLPSGFQSALFGLSNVFLASAVNTFSTATVSGNAVSQSIGGYTANAATAIYQATLTFTGQNAGAAKHDRVRRVLLCGIVQSSVIVALMGWGSYLFSDSLTRLFIDSTHPEAAAIARAAKERMMIVPTTYFICGIMEVFTGHLRGKKCSFTPMVTTLIFTCLFRVLWIFFVFPGLEKSLFSLYLCYPISWGITAISHAVTAYILSRHEKKQAAEQRQANASTLA